MVPCNIFLKKDILESCNETTMHCHLEPCVNETSTQKKKRNTKLKRSNLYGFLKTPLLKDNCLEQEVTNQPSELVALHKALKKTSHVSLSRKITLLVALKSSIRKYGSKKHQLNKEHKRATLAMEQYLSKIQETPIHACVIVSELTLTNTLLI